MNERGIAPKLIADQQGHGVDVNQNVYTMTSVKQAGSSRNSIEAC
jgi:hypothetical protein